MRIGRARTGTAGALNKSTVVQSQGYRIEATASDIHELLKRSSRQFVFPSDLDCARVKNTFAKMLLGHANSVSTSTTIKVKSFTEPTTGGELRRW